MIDWIKFEDSLTNYVDKQISNDIVEFSTYLADLYYLTVINGIDQYSNTIINLEKKPLSLSLYILFSKIQRKQSPINISFDMNNAFNLFWSTCIMNINSIIPGTTNSISNTITKLGNGGTIILQNNRSSSYFVNSIVTFCKLYTSTIAGSVTALQIIPGGVTPVPYPWVGIN